jgi:hypothetical protein
MQTLRITQGADKDYPLQAHNTGGQTNPAYAAADTLAAYVYRGQDQAVLFATPVAWYAPVDPVTLLPLQTGYDQGQVLVSISKANSATLDPGGSYLLLVWWTKADLSRTEPIARCMLLVEPAAGLGTQLIVPYCSYKDMLDHAPWIGLTRDLDSDQEGYYSQRLQARKWLDDLIIGSWQGTSYAAFGDPGFPASQWSGGWGGRTPLTSQWLRDRLTTGGFTAPAVITSSGTGYATAPDVTVQAPGGLGTQATWLATVNLDGTLATITPVAPGSGYVAGAVYPPVITGGGGTGGAAMATTTAGALMLREPIIRACAFKAIGIVGKGQPGSKNQYAQQGYMFERMADDEVLSATVELDLNLDGLADTAVVIGAAPVFYT